MAHAGAAVPVICYQCHQTIMAPPGTNQVRCGVCQAIVNVPMPMMAHPQPHSGQTAPAAMYPPPSGAQPSYSGAHMPPPTQYTPSSMPGPYAAPMTGSQYHPHPQPQGPYGAATSSISHPLPYAQQPSGPPPQHPQPPNGRPPSMAPSYTQPVQHQPQIVQVRNKRKAMLIGINYHGTRNELGGCINDANCMKFLLTKRFGFHEDEILLLTETNPNPVMHPTRKNIFKGISWLVKGASAGDKLFFHYSGHGGQKRDRDGDEADGYDETLLPLDFQRAGQITDDEIHERMVMPLPEGCVLHCVIDACHSGSVLDLPYHWLVESREWKTEKKIKTCLGQVVCFAACGDNQEAASSNLLGYTSSGVMTHLFVKAVVDGHASTYASLLARIQDQLKVVVAPATGPRPRQTDPQAVHRFDSGLGPAGLFHADTGFTQRPQLSSSAKDFDLNTPFMLV
eukprot:m.114185 g.114185  ORF g.114185 m.114185 type:complete len:452 (-) comp15468_c0_seq3:103-1458(-)